MHNSTPAFKTSKKAKFLKHWVWSQFSITWSPPQASLLQVSWQLHKKVIQCAKKCFIHRTLFALQPSFPFTCKVLCRHCSSFLFFISFGSPTIPEGPPLIWQTRDRSWEESNYLETDKQQLVAEPEINPDSIGLKSPLFPSSLRNSNVEKQ